MIVSRIYGFRVSTSNNLLAFLEVGFTSSSVFEVDRELNRSFANAVNLRNEYLNLQ